MKRSERRQHRHLRYMSTQIQFPASRDAKVLEKGSAAVLRESIIIGTLLESGAATETMPALLVFESARTSAPMTLKLSAPLMVLSSEPKTPASL